MVSKLVSLLLSGMLLLLFITAVHPLRGMISKPPRYYYCQLESCSNPERHVLCLYRNSTVHPRCHYHMYSGLTAKEQQDLVNEHNEIKKRHGSLKKVNFAEIAWDHDLEEMAQRWSDQCKATNDECRSVHDNGYIVKQNVGYYQVKDQAPKFRFSKRIDFNFSKAIQDWAHTPFNPANPAVWRYRGLNKIGCGLTIKSEHDWRNRVRYASKVGSGNYFHVYFVCNYAISQIRCYDE